MALDNGAFSPDRAAARRDLVTALYRMAGWPDTYGEFSIPDVTDADPAYAELVWAVDRGILTGFSDGTIRPDASVTREQLAVILYRMQPEAPASGAGAEAKLHAFEDWEMIHGYAWDAVGWAVSSGILNGVSDTVLAPGGTVTRAQLASILLRVQAL